MKIILKIDRVSFHYQVGQKVLQGIELKIRQGDFWGIIGPNGSGKSTLLKTMNAVLKPREGVITLQEWDLHKLSRPQIAREMGLVPQETTLGFNFNVQEIVAMGRTPHLTRFQRESKKDAEIVKNAMELTKCFALRGRFMSELSGGEKQRVIFARALAQEPRILLLDEPTSQLDISFQMELFNLLRRLNEGGMTIVAVLHDLNLAAQYCQKLLLLNQGKIFAAGPPAEVISEEHIRSVYQTEVLVEHHPLSGSPQVILVPARRREQNANFIYHRLHIISGGGSAGNLYQECYETGLEVSTGVLNIGDSDWQQAHRLGLKIIEEKPFSPISPEAHRRHLRLLETTEAIVITGVPFGHGNMLNLEAALAACQKGVPVYLLNATDSSARDYTGGQASAYIQELLALGALKIGNKEDLWRLWTKKVPEGEGG